MKERIIYIAEDGKEFDDKLECLSYEENQMQIFQIVFDNFTFYTQDFETMNFNSPEELREEGYDVCECCYYFFTKSNDEDVLKALEDFGRIFDMPMDVDRSIPSSTKFYYYQDGHGCYQTADEEIFSRLNFLKELKKLGMDISL